MEKYLTKVPSLMLFWGLVILNSKSMIRGCIFDLDGVIVDTAKYHYSAWKRLADHLQIPFSEEENEKMKGISRMASLEIILALGDVKFSEKEKIKYCATKNTWYLELVEDMGEEEILPGIIEFIQELKEAGIKIALGSASKNARAILQKVNLSDQFDAIVDGNDVVKSKPDPEVFLNGAALLYLEPSEVLVIEDSAKGIEAAIKGGFQTLGIGQTENLSQAKWVVPSLKGITVEQVMAKL